MNQNTPNEDNYDKLKLELFSDFVKHTEKKLNEYESKIEKMMQTVGNMNEQMIDVVDVIYRTQSANTQLEIDAKISTALEKFELESHTKKEVEKKPFPVLNSILGVLGIVALMIAVKELLMS